MKGWVRVVRSIGIALAVSFLICLWLGQCHSDRMIFYASRDGNWDAWNRKDAKIEEVWLTTGDGVKTLSWHLRQEKPRATVLFFHGNAGNIAHRTGTLLSLAKLNVDVFMVGYHGYGRSEGHASEAAIYLDADAAYAYLTEKCGVPASRVIVFGESLGGAPAIELASKKPCGGLIIQSAFSSIRDMSRVVIPQFPAYWFLRSKMDNLRKIPRVGAPKIFIAATADEIVPCEQTRKLFDAAVEPREWRQFADCRHNDLFWAHNRAWLETIGGFLDRVTP